MFCFENRNRAYRNSKQFLCFSKSFTFFSYSIAQNKYSANTKQDSYEQESASLGARAGESRRNDYTYIKNSAVNYEAEQVSKPKNLFIQSKKLVYSV